MLTLDDEEKGVELSSVLKIVGDGKDVAIVVVLTIGDEEINVVLLSTVDEASVLVGLKLLIVSWTEEPSSDLELVRAETIEVNNCPSELAVEDFSVVAGVNCREEFSALV